MVGQKTTYDDDRLQPYRESGVLTGMGVVSLLLVGIALVVVLGFAYGYVTGYFGRLPDFILDTVSYASSVGAGLAFTAYRCKLRHTRFVTAIGFLFGLLAWYAAWVSWVFAVSADEVLVFSPSGISWYVYELMASGDFSKSDLELCVYWIGEAVIIVAVTMYFAGFLIKNRPFCEECNRWVDDKEIMVGIPYIDNEEEISGGSVRALMEAVERPICGRGFKGFGRLMLRQCGSCRSCQFLTIENAPTERTKRIRKLKGNRVLAQNLVIDAALYEKLKTVGADSTEVI